MKSNEYEEVVINERGTPLLDIRNPSVDYCAASGTVHALDNVNITLDRGQILGLVGESGSASPLWPTLSRVCCIICGE